MRKMYGVGSRNQKVISNQTVHAGFGAQPSKRELSLNVQGRTLDTGDLSPETSTSSALNPFASLQRKYMRRSISAQSCASVPPEPA